jgi:uncharacterized protein (TIGR02145 family)
MKTTLLSLTTLLLMAFGLHQSNDALQTNATVTDIDGNTYKTVTIGELTWMAENLNVSKFRNGDVIMEAKNWDEWNKALEEKRPAFCYFNFDNESKNGKLYNRFAIEDKRVLAPEGFRVSSSNDWITLLTPLKPTSEQNRGFKSSKELKTTSGWNKKNGTNSWGFSAYPYGELYQNTFRSEGDAVVYWGGIRYEEKPDIIKIESYYNGTNIFLMDPYNSGVYVRCVKVN